MVTNVSFSKSAFTFQIGVSIFDITPSSKAVNRILSFPQNLQPLKPPGFPSEIVHREFLQEILLLGLRAEDCKAEKLSSTSGILLKFLQESFLGFRFRTTFWIFLIHKFHYLLLKFSGWISFTKFFRKFYMQEYPEESPKFSYRDPPGLFLESSRNSFCKSLTCSF